MGFTESVKSCLRNYANFNGRAARPEFWWFYLFTLLVSFVLILPGVAVILAAVLPESDEPAGGLLALGIILVVLGGLAQLALFIPFLAVGSRRLHDRGLSAWLLLLYFVPAGNIALIVLWVLDGTPGDNAYGPRPT